MTSYVRTLLAFVLTTVGCFASTALGQTETASISGRVTDGAGAAVVGADVELQSIERGTGQQARSNEAGLYSFSSVQPGQYHLTVRRAGFKTVDSVGLVVNVQDHVEKNFQLQIGSVSESVTVSADDLHINTTDASVSTIVDRNFAENLPLNGRSFQTLIQLTPGVVLTASNYNDNGQFSVNGQRASSNYWMVDGVSANIGVGISQTSLNPGNGFAGAIGSFSAAGGTNSLVSVDALQEFRIQTSTYAPEFGRTPGGQISIVTRSGSNQLHGTIFDYFRNDILDANNWFANANDLAKPEERQNDFGGTVGGRILKDRTFFFFSYEGLRLRLPQVVETTVPDLNSRATAMAAVQPYLNAFPIPNGPDDAATGIAGFNASFSNRSTLDAYSLRIDHKLSDKVSLFGRYNYSPSETDLRVNALSTIQPTRITTQTATVGATWMLSSRETNDIRFNYSRTDASSYSQMDSFGGAIPLASLPFPNPFTSANGELLLDIFPLQQGSLIVGKLADSLQRQINVVDALSLQRGSHTLKFGADFRRLSPAFSPAAYEQASVFLTVPSAATGAPFVNIVSTNLNPTLLFRNLGLYIQDTWRFLPRLTLTYGLRWDVDFVPQSLHGPALSAVTGFNLNDLSNLTLAPSGVPPYKTTYGNVAPRIGLAYQLRQSQGWQTVLRGGFGVFYDLASSEVGNQIGVGKYPFSGFTQTFGGTFPLDPAAAIPPPIVPPNATNSGTLHAFDPNLTLPYTLEWNIAVEQGLGSQQTVSASYIGAAGRRLLETAEVLSPNANLADVQLVANSGESDYNALQIQLQRRLSHGFQVLGSYAWSHSIDTGSAGSTFLSSNALVPFGVGGSNRGPSDFDIRHAFSAGVTYALPTLRVNRLLSAIIDGWSLQNIVQAHSAPPVDISDTQFSQFDDGALGDVRPDLVPGQPLYLYGSQYAGGKAFNPAAFTSPPVDPTTGNPLRQGDVPRNFLRGFGAAQWDFAVHRDFPIHEWLRLQFRAEFFNVINHPNFGPPSGQFGVGSFGVSTQTLGQSLSGQNPGNGAFDSLYQIGGPRSVQLALKLIF